MSENELYKARDIIDDFLRLELKHLIDCLGKDHVYNAGSATTVGEIKDAYDFLVEWFS
jgi:hypothetical protein